MKREFSVTEEVGLKQGVGWVEEFDLKPSVSCGTSCSWGTIAEELREETTAGKIWLRLLLSFSSRSRDGGGGRSVGLGLQ